MDLLDASEQLRGRELRASSTSSGVLSSRFSRLAAAFAFFARSRWSFSKLVR
jgi:hypothetical protein